MIARAAVFFAAIALAACGGGDPTAPRISALQLSPEGGVRPGDRLTIVVQLVDEDGDVAGGDAEVGWLREGASGEGALYRVPLDAEGEVTEAKIEVFVTFPAGEIPGRYDFAIVILDRATRRSNVLVTKFDVLN